MVRSCGVYSILTLKGLNKSFFYNMVGFDERIFKTSQLLRRKITQKETKTCIQFKKEINYSSSHNTIFSSNQVFFLLTGNEKEYS